MNQRANDVIRIAKPSEANMRGCTHKISWHALKTLNYLLTSSCMQRSFGPFLKRVSNSSPNHEKKWEEVFCQEPRTAVMHVQRRPGSSLAAEHRQRSTDFTALRTAGGLSRRQMIKKMFEIEAAEVEGAFLILTWVMLTLYSPLMQLSSVCHKTRPEGECPSRSNSTPTVCRAGSLLNVCKYMNLNPKNLTFV